jgi:hypothetical protein
MAGRNFVRRIGGEHRCTNFSELTQLQQSHWTDAKYSRKMLRSVHSDTPVARHRSSINSGTLTAQVVCKQNAVADADLDVAPRTRRLGVTHQATAQRAERGPRRLVDDRERQRATFRITRRRAEVIGGVGVERGGRRAADGRRQIHGLGLGGGEGAATSDVDKRMINSSKLSFDASPQRAVIAAVRVCVWQGKLALRSRR